MAIIASALLIRVLWLASISASALPHQERSSSPMPQYDLPDYISQSIGPYSARYPVHSFGGYKHISSDLPHGCDVVQVNILQRHGARYPTSSNSWSSIDSAVSKIKAAALLSPQAAAHSPLAFVSTYRYTLGKNSLVDFGRLQAYTSGKYISDHYHHLSSNGAFIRSTTKDRILESARWFKHGFEGKSFPFPINDLGLPNVVIPTGPSNNNTLSVDNCEAAEAAPEDPNAPNMQWLSIYAAPIAKRLSAFIPGLDLTPTDANALMSLCGFDTAFQNGKASPWCGIFKEDEWTDNEYYWDLEKYYGSSYGFPYAKAQGSGWVNELIARLTGKPVVVTGAINGTLDSDPETFPLPPNSPSIFADFSSDNNIAHMIAALGILDDATPLPAQGPPPKNHLFVTSKLVPFSTSLVVEKLVCRRQVHLQGHDSATEEYMRIVLNEGVVPLDLQECGKIGVELGMCRLEDFVKSQSFSQGGADWDKVCSLP